MEVQQPFTVGDSTGDKATTLLLDTPALAPTFDPFPPQDPGRPKTALAHIAERVEELEKRVGAAAGALGKIADAAFGARPEEAAPGDTTQSVTALGATHDAIDCLQRAVSKLESIAARFAGLA